MVLTLVLLEFLLVLGDEQLLLVAEVLAEEFLHVLLDLGGNGVVAEVCMGQVLVHEQDVLHDLERVVANVVLPDADLLQALVHLQRVEDRDCALV